MARITTKVTPGSDDAELTLKLRSGNIRREVPFSPFDGMPHRIAALTFAQELFPGQWLNVRALESNPLGTGYTFDVIVEPVTDEDESDESVTSLVLDQV